jgi:hypothetical protein
MAILSQLKKVTITKNIQKIITIIFVQEDKTSLVLSNRIIERALSINNYSDGWSIFKSGT